MNTELIKDGLIFIGGIGVGILGSYLFIKKRYEIIADGEIDSIREYYAKRFPDEITDGVAKKTDGEASGDHKKDTVSFDITSKERPNRQMIDYTTYYNADNDIAGNEHPEDDEYDRNYEEGKAETEKRQSAGKPKLIKAGEFGSAGYAEQTLLYYTENRVLANEDDEIIATGDLDEVESLLGDTLVKFGFDKNNEEKIYVRNDRNRCDYEIIKVFDSFEV